MCNRNSQQKSKSSMRCVGETHAIKKKKKKKKKQKKKINSTGCVRETPHIKTKSAWDV